MKTLLMFDLKFLSPTRVVILSGEIQTGNRRKCLLFADASWMSFHHKPLNAQYWSNFGDTTVAHNVGLFNLCTMCCSKTTSKKTNKQAKKNSKSNLAGSSSTTPEISGNFYFMLGFCGCHLGCWGFYHHSLHYWKDVKFTLNNEELCKSEMEF